MKNRDDNADLETEDFSGFEPEPWVIEAGLMVVDNGQVKVTAKGLLALRAVIDADNSAKKPS